ncbi:MAG: ABC transporter substrate-binding protein [Patescibacteria group bacterium]
MKRTLTLLAIPLLLVACAPKEEEGPIRIGYIGPLTGDAASFGADTVNGARLAVEEVNATGGINGRMVSLIAEDARCNGADAASAARKLISIDKVTAIIGGQCSSETLGAAPIAEEEKIVMISPVSSSPDVTHAGDYIFRVYPSDALKGTALVNAFAKAGYSRIALLSENTDFCAGVRSAVQAALKEDMTIIFDETVEPGTKDFRTLLSRLKDQEFDVFIPNGQSDVTVSAMVQQMRELGLLQPIIGTDTADSVTLGQTAKEAVEGMRALSVPSLAKNDPKGGPFIQKFEEEFRAPQVGPFFAALSYEATRLLADVIKTAGTEGEAIRNALLTHPGYDSIVGTMTFDAQGDIRGIPFALKEFRSGELIEVERIPIN